MKRLEAALKAFGPGFHVYQYLFKSNRPDIPFAKYDDPIVEAAIEQRRKFFEAKRDHLYQVEIFYCILLEGARSKTGVGAAFSQLFRDPAGAIGELKAQFTNDNMKTLLRTPDRARCCAPRPARAGIRSAARGLHADRSLGPAAAVHVLPPVAELTTTGALRAGRSPRSFSTIKSSTRTSKPNAIICAWAITSSGC